MAELAAISAVVGLVGAGTQISILLFDLASAIGGASKELHYIATEVSLFCSVLKELQFTLEEADRYGLTPAAISLAQRIANECQAVISEIGTTVGSLRKAQGPSDFPSVDWINKVKFTFKKSKIQVQRQTLESCKSTLVLFLTTARWSRRQSQRKYVARSQPSPILTGQGCHTGDNCTGPGGSAHDTRPGNGTAVFHC